MIVSSEMIFKKYYQHYLVPVLLCMCESGLFLKNCVKLQAQGTSDLLQLLYFLRNKAHLGNHR